MANHFTNGKIGYTLRNADENAMRIISEKNLNKLFILVCVGLLLAGCGMPTKHPNLFGDLVCEPPCWEYIVPGATTKEDALVALSGVDAVDQPISDLENTARGFDSELRFSLYGQDNLSGSIFITDGRVSLIEFGTELDISLEEAIELFGAPQSILAFHSNLYWVTLVNPQTGIAFGYSSVGHPNWVYSEIRPEVGINVVMFFDPKQYEQILDSGFLSYYLLSSEETKSKLRPWNGYGDLSQYEE